MLKYHFKNSIQGLFYRLCLACAFLCFFIGSSVFNVAGAVSKQEYGFVEYQTEASINFTNDIKVVLTDKSTGDYHTHYLYRINDYQANKQIPLGTYSIVAEILPNDEEASSLSYSLNYSNEDVVVKETGLATPISLSVDIFDNVVASPDDYSEEYRPELQEETQILEDLPSENNQEDNNQKNKDNSLLISALFFCLILILLAIGYWLYKRKLNSEK